MIMLCGLLVNPKATVASMGILIQTTSLVYVFPSSLSLGVSTRVGNELGANRPAKARTCMIVSLFCAVGLGMAAMVFTTSMRHQWGRFFTDDQEILNLTAIALPIVGLCELGNCPQTTGCGVLRGCARPTVGANINLSSFYLVGMPVAIALGFVVKMGFAGLWFGLLAAQATCAGLMLFVLCKTDWNAQAQKAKELTNASSSSSVNKFITKGEECNKNINSYHNNDLEKIVIAGENDELGKIREQSSSFETDPLITPTTNKHNNNVN
ncbi:Protein DETOXIFICATION 48 [Stylosanthes scabra]|uniref:Protein DETOXIFICATION 48 n=1 Tax=Stylosanthes scabra TaxID=79078 RepID=A0ABU6THJ9_9FABA|nr:Protein DETOXIFICATION 48 [Stylosanthes scabra]